MSKEFHGYTLVQWDGRLTSVLLDRSQVVVHDSKMDVAAQAAIKNRKAAECATNGRSVARIFT
jgi:hypothetical protein